MFGLQAIADFHMRRAKLSSIVAKLSLFGEEDIKPMAPVLLRGHVTKFEALVVTGLKATTNKSKMKELCSKHTERLKESTRDPQIHKLVHAALWKAVSDAIST
jgi:hypothetical protein